LLSYPLTGSPNTVTATLSLHAALPIFPGHAELTRGGPGHRPDGGEALLEAPGGVRQRQRTGDRGSTRREHGEPDAELLKGARHARRAAGHAIVEAREAPLDRGHLRRGEVARGEHEAEAEVVERHGLRPPPSGLLDLLGFARTLLADALEEPVAVGGGHGEHLRQACAEARASVLSPAHLEDALAPAIDVYPWKELVRPRRRAARSLPGMKKVRSKGRSTSWVAKHSGHSISMPVSTPQSTRSNSSTRKSASRRLRSSMNFFLSRASMPSTSSTRKASIADKS